MALRIQDAASLRLDVIFRFNRPQVERYITELFLAFEKIDTQGRASRPEPADFGVDGFWFRHAPHVVYWRRLANGDIGIVTILHERMHQMDWFRDDLADWRCRAQSGTRRGNEPRASLLVLTALSICPWLTCAKHHCDVRLPWKILFSRHCPAKRVAKSPGKCPRPGVAEEPPVPNSTSRMPSETRNSRTGSSASPADQVTVPIFRLPLRLHGRREIPVRSPSTARRRPTRTPSGGTGPRGR